MVVACFNLKDVTILLSAPACLFSGRACLPCEFVSMFVKHAMGPCSRLCAS